MKDNYGQGPVSASPARDWIAARFGPSVPSSSVETYEAIARQLVAACGVPPELLDARTPGPALREAWRWFHAATLEPLAVVLAEELAEKLGRPRAPDPAPRSGPAHEDPGRLELALRG